MSTASLRAPWQSWRISSAAQPHRTATDRFVDRAHDQPLVEFGCARITERYHFSEVVPGIDMQQRKRKLGGAKGLLREAQQHERVLAAGEEQNGVRALSGHFSQDENRLGLEPIEVTARGWRSALGERFFQDGAHVYASVFSRTSRPSGERCRPHSRASGCSHHQRPARTSSLVTVGRVQGAQPIER